MEVGSIAIIEILFNSTDDFCIEFYIEREKSVRFRKEELLSFATSEGLKFYVVIDSMKLGRGNLMCRAEVYDKESNVDNRIVVLSGATGLYFGACVCGGRSGRFSCQEYSFGFKKVTDIPKPINGDIYIGVIKRWIEDYNSITEAIILEEVENGNINVENVLPDNLKINVEEGDKLVVLIPSSDKLRATRQYILNNDTSYKSEFNTEVIGANGDVTVYVKGIPYKVYGEFAILGGNKNINIE